MGRPRKEPTTAIRVWTAEATWLGETPKERLREIRLGVEDREAEDDRIRGTREHAAKAKKPKRRSDEEILDQGTRQLLKAIKEHDKVQAAPAAPLAQVFAKVQGPTFDLSKPQVKPTKGKKP
jgi:hypothetical protein